MPQGTVKSYDTKTRTATLLDDQLVELAVDTEAFVASGLRELRIGQRVRFEVDSSPDDGDRITNLNIVTL